MNGGLGMERLKNTVSFPKFWGSDAVAVRCPFGGLGWCGFCFEDLDLDLRHGKVCLGEGLGVLA